MHLEPVSEHAPAGAAELLTQLGAGETGFSGTAFGRGEYTLDAFLRATLDEQDPTKLLPDYVPQTTFWMIDGDPPRAVGMLRLRHYLNAPLLQSGGNIGYYVAPACRGRGYATQALGLALPRLRALGADRALLTVYPENTASNRVIRANGGVPDGQSLERGTGLTLNRYWIDLRAL